MTGEQVIQLEVVVEPQPEGGYTVTCPMLPGLVTEGDTLDEALSNVPDAARAVLELYEEENRQPPPEIFVEVSGESITVQTTALVAK